MSLTDERKQEVIQVIIHSIREKFKKYSPETTYKPFHHSLLGKDRMSLFSFIQSINTTFGTSIYEPVAKTVGKDKFFEAKSQIKPYSKINKQVQSKIQEILDGIETKKRAPDKVLETNQLKETFAIAADETSDVSLIKADIWLEDENGALHLIDIKTVKPNKNEFRSYKRILLEWLAAELTRDSKKDVYTYIGIPYNPYHPKEYDRWTLSGMLDVKNEVLVAQEMWDFIGGDGTYVDLLDCFDQAGNELRPEIDSYFKQFIGG